MKFICFNSEEHISLFKHQMILCVTVKHTQFSIGGFDVVHVLHGFVQAMQHDSTVSSNHGVSHDGSGIVQVSKVPEVPLGPRDSIPCQRLLTNDVVVHLGEDVLDGGPLKFCPLNHVSDFRCSDKLP
uniref:Uncharacterized protein n=1 Tax=Cyprinus carpio carpio TaxID=630221 RepID=A0A8C1EZ77_CYPCA